MSNPRITPNPTDEEVAAIVAAVEALWPKPITSVEDKTAAAARWRFSGRWWNRATPAAARRGRRPRA